MIKTTWALLVCALLFATGCFHTQAWEVPTRVAEAHKIETALLVAFHGDANDFVAGLITDLKLVSEERDTALNLPAADHDSAETADQLRARWAELNVNYELAMQVRVVYATWLGLIDTIEELVGNGGPDTET